MWVLAGAEEGLSDHDISFYMIFLQIWNFLITEAKRPCVTWGFKGKYLNSSVLSSILCAWQFSSLVLDDCHDLRMSAVKSMAYRVLPCHGAKCRQVYSLKMRWAFYRFYLISINYVKHYTFTNLKWAILLWCVKLWESSKTHPHHLFLLCSPVCFWFVCWKLPRSCCPTMSFPHTPLRCTVLQAADGDGHGVVWGVRACGSSGVTASRSFGVKSCDPQVFECW